MAWKLCDTPRCGTKIRTGLVRLGTGVDGQKLADGRHCWRCRARRAIGTRTRKKK